jgi:hypothetical protein
MKNWLVWLMVSLSLVLVVSYAWTHRHHGAIPPAIVQVPQTQGTYAEAQQAQQMVTVTGPMADYMLHQKPGNVETPLSGSHKPSANDHIEGVSPVGTSSAILHKTFRVAGVVDAPFDIPAHASAPKLHGTYRSFVQQGGTSSSDSTADVAFLLLNQQQYGDFLNGRPGDALLSADSAHDGEVNFNLPPTFGQAAKYYLVFRNESRSEGKKVVQADFRVDF